MGVVITSLAHCTSSSKLAEESFNLGRSGLAAMELVSHLNALLVLLALCSAPALCRGEWNPPTNLQLYFGFNNENYAGLEALVTVCTTRILDFVYDITNYQLISTG